MLSKIGLTMLQYLAKIDELMLRGGEFRSRSPKTVREHRSCWFTLRIPWRLLPPGLRKIAGKEDDGKGSTKMTFKYFQRVIISHPILPVCFAGFQLPLVSHIFTMNSCAAPRGSKMWRFTFRSGEILALMINFICSYVFCRWCDLPFFYWIRNGSICSLNNAAMIPDIWFHMF